MSERDQSGRPLTPAERIAMDEESYAVTGLRGPDNRTLYIVEPDLEKIGYPHGAMGRHPGAMWRWPEHDLPASVLYELPVRECWVIVLPNRSGAWWTTYRSEPGGVLWEVTGEPPLITVNPSINAGDGPGLGNWHGWIKDGVMTP